MRPYYQGPVGDPLKYQLPYDDKLRIWQLYGVRDLLISTSRPGAEEPSDYPALPKPPKSRPTAQLRPDAPDRCNAHFDAVAQIRGEAFFFKGKYFWRLTRNKHLVSLQPAQIQRFWWGLPSNLGNLDAVYERSVDHKIVFFKGSRYWVFKDNNVEEGYPRLLADFGLPVQGIEAAFVWPHNDKTYFFKDNQYWRYDDHSRRLDPEAPEESLLWKGLPSNIDDAMRWSDGTTYFFKGKSYWKVLDGHTEVSADSPRSIARDWLMCSDMQADGVEVELASSRHGHPDHTRSEEEEKKKQQQQQQPSCSCTSSAAQPSGPEAVWRQRAAHLVAGLLFATAAAAVV
uniref:Matrix metallopeptidase 17 n=1 Tax=Callorhinchus milii TaxID=7868 RepID=A0A4W3IZW6_CALMI